MNRKNLSSLTIRVRDFNLVARQPELVTELRKLTLYPTSGMNKEIENLSKLMQTRPVDCKVLLAYLSGKLVGWAILSKEHSAIRFTETYSYFRPGDGVLFELFVDPAHRRQGIGTALLQVAKRKANGTRMCIAPWDIRSYEFYGNFKYKFKIL